MSLGKDALIALLKYHDDKYYNQDAPEITDIEYDALKKSYVELYGEYNYVPGEAKFNKVEHTHPILSLDKLQIGDEEGILNSLKRLGRIEDGVCIEPKFDGLTVVIYPNGKFVTRGNGKIGEDITSKCMQIEGLKDIKTSNILRAEILMPISEFNRINKERAEQGLELYKNPRNAAAGMIRNDTLSKIQGLKAFIYEDLDAKGTHTEIICDLTNKYHEMVTPLNYFDDYDDALDFIKSYDREALDYEIDGLVVKSDVPNSLKEFGSTGHHPKNAIAIKFEAEGGWTTINRVVWQVGRTGKITPVAEFEPIEILGAEVTRATLHNYGIMEALNLTNIVYEGKYDSKTEVFVVKANDVIPAIIEVKHSTEIKEPYMQLLHEPKECPVCKGEVEKVNDQLFCIAPNCPSKIVGRLVHMAKRDAFDIGGLSEETAKKIMDTLVDVENPHPCVIYDFTVEDFMKLEGFAKKSATNLYNEIQKTLTIPFDRFLYGCGMPLVGRTASKDIAEFYYNKDKSELTAFVDDYYDGFKKLKTLKGIGEETIKSLLANYEEMIVPFGYYEFNVTDVIPTKKASNQLSFVITGAFDIPRKEIEKLIKDAGHKTSGSVSKKTNYLLASPGEEGTSKYKTAIELGIPIINSIEKLKELI